jgi:hypothetical protein
MPNAGSILKRLGVEVADCGGNFNEQVSFFTYKFATRLPLKPDSIYQLRWKTATRD